MDAVTDLKDMLGKKWPGAVFKTGNGSVFSTDIEPIDALLPLHGIPFGQMIELTGPASSGKTSLLYKIMAKITGQGSAVYFDLSNSFFPSAATYYGVDIDRLAVVKTDDPLEGMRAAELLLEHQKTACVVLDLADQKKVLPMTLLHRLRMQTTKSKGLTIFLTEDNSHIIPSSIVSLRLSINRLSRREVEIEITKSRISREGLKTRVVLYD